MSGRRGGSSDPLTILVGILVAAALLSGLATWVESGDAGRAAHTAWDRVFGDDEPADAGAPAARAALPKLRVAARGDLAGYERGPDQWGTNWYDADRNGCDTRNDILRRDLTGETFRAGSRCVVVSGTLRDPYTGDSITFTKADAGKVQIDHVVPLAEAWRSGARSWTTTRRRSYANDPLVLLAVDGPTNAAKGDSPPDEWQPDKGRCAYAVRYVRIKAKWELTVTSAERDALSKMLRACP